MIQGFDERWARGVLAGIEPLTALFVQGTDYGVQGLRVVGDLLARFSAAMLCFTNPGRGFGLAVHGGLDLKL
jgi:hypothetical protein